MERSVSHPEKQCPLESERPIPPPCGQARRAIVWLSLLVIVVSLRVMPVAAQAPMALKAEYQHQPVGIDVAHPRLTWLPAGDQAAYQIQVAVAAGALRSGKNLLWDTGQVASGQSAQVAYGGPAL